MYFITLYNMRKQINQVKEFNDAFKLPYSISPVLIDLKNARVKSKSSKGRNRRIRCSK